MNKEVKRRKKEKLRNKKLVKKYYWLKPTSWYRKKEWKYDYSYIDWFGWPNGWNQAFGMMYLKELDEAIKESGQKDFQILQMKEKFGQARCYTSGTSDKIDRIIDKYEYLSENICWRCGKPDVPMIDDGWMHPICFDCFRINMKRREKYINKPPLTEEEIKAAYEKYIIDEGPDENGEYKMCNTYTIRRFSKDGTQDTVYDVSETAQAIRDRWEKRRKKYEKWIHRRKHSS